MDGEWPLHEFFNGFAVKCSVVLLALLVLVVVSEAKYPGAVGSIPGAVGNMVAWLAGIMVAWLAEIAGKTASSIIAWAFGSTRGLIGMISLEEWCMLFAVYCLCVACVPSIWRAMRARSGQLNDDTRQLANGTKDAEKIAAERKEAATKEAETKHVAAVADVKEAKRQEAARKEAAKQAAAKKEADRKEAAKQAAAKKEADRKEAAKKLAEQRALAKKEMERTEAAKKLAEKKQARAAATMQHRGICLNFVCRRRWCYSRKYPSYEHRCQSYHRRQSPTPSATRTLTCNAQRTRC
jgi:hypothetical protein